MRCRITRFEQRFVESGLSVKQLASRSRVSASTIRRCIDLGIEKTSVGNAWKLAHAMGVKIDDLLGDAR